MLNLLVITVTTVKTTADVFRTDILLWRRYSHNHSIMYLQCDMFRLQYNKPSAREIKVPNKSYNLHYIKPLFCRYIQFRSKLYILRKTKYEPNLLNCCVSATGSTLPDIGQLYQCAVLPGDPEGCNTYVVFRPLQFCGNLGYVLGWSLFWVLSHSLFKYFNISSS
jgi:hypothetical protein